jgi:mannose-6-phosphate isomerase-like protein (cupin superfamily)
MDVNRRLRPVDGYRVARLDDIEEVTDGRCPWQPVRAHFDIRSFGINAWTGHAAGDRIINEHDEEGEDEELYFVWRGRARFELDGENVDAPSGSFVFAPPGVKRTAFAEEPGTTILVAGAHPGEAFQPGGWELWAPVRPLYEAGRYEEAADAGRTIVDEHPGYPLTLYNLACVEALAGRPQDAIGHLRQAIELAEVCREYATGDTDFDAIREEPGFQELIGS